METRRLARPCYTWRNPPHALIEAEVARHLPFLLSMGDMLPHLDVLKCSITPLGSAPGDPPKTNQYHLNLVVENTGFLPSFTSQQAKERKAARPVRVELELPEGVTLVSGKRRIDLGHLEGRSSDLDVTAVGVASPTSNRQRLEWVLCAAPGAAITLKVLSERAGSLTKTITLP